MNYRAEVIAGHGSKKRDFIVIYRILLKLEDAWEDNHFLMVKCSKMLAKACSLGGAPDLNQLCLWMSKYVGVSMDIFEVRSLMRYVNIIINDKTSRTVGYCDLHPPSKRGYEQWCVHLAELANQNLTSAKERQSQAFQQQIEKLSMLNDVTDNKKIKKKKKKKKVKPAATIISRYRSGKLDTAFRTPASSVVSGESETKTPLCAIQEMLPSTSSVSLQEKISTCTTPTPHSSKINTKTSSSRKKKKTGEHSSSTKLALASSAAGCDVEVKSDFHLPSLKKANSAKPSLLNTFTSVVVQARIKKHMDQNKQHFLATEFPELRNPNNIDYTIAPVLHSSRSAAGLCDRKNAPVVKRAVSFYDQVDEEVFGDKQQSAQQQGARRPITYIDEHGLLREEGASKMIKERKKFKLESEKVKNEVFATLGL